MTWKWGYRYKKRGGGNTKWRWSLRIKLIWIFLSKYQLFFLWHQILQWGSRHGGGREGWRLWGAKCHGSRETHSGYVKKEIYIRIWFFSTEWPIHQPKYTLPFKVDSYKIITVASMQDAKSLWYWETLIFTYFLDKELEINVEKIVLLTLLGCWKTQ